MQQQQQRPTVPGFMPVSEAIAGGLLTTPASPKAPIDAKRVGRDDRGLPHFGPLPGEKYPDEAHFGSFS